MSRRNPRRPPHRPSALTSERRDRIVTLIEGGNHLRTACAAAGVSKSVFYKWLNRGEDARTAAEAANQPVPDAERVYVDFVDAVSRARACAETKAVRIVQRTMTGGFVLSEEPLVGPGGGLLRGDDGEILYKRIYSQPDGRLALEYLARSRPTEWGRNQPAKVEVSGSDGGSVPIEQSVVIASLAERVASVVAQRKADAELDAAEQGTDGAYEITGDEAN